MPAGRRGDRLQLHIQTQKEREFMSEAAATEDQEHHTAASKNSRAFFGSFAATNQNHLRTEPSFSTTLMDIDSSDHLNASRSFDQIPTSCNPETAGEKTGKEEDANEKTLPSPFMEPTPLDKILELSSIIKERMTQALQYFKESTEQNQILAQVWAPKRSGNNFVLTTSGQPFVLDPHSNGLIQCRTISQVYMFAIDEEINGTLGLPGRVFRQKLPEWTPNVQFYSSKEYPRVDHAKHYNVRGTLALPMFEPSEQSSVGVLELIMTSEKINYAPEVDKICKALEAVNLKSSRILDHPNIQICNEGRQKHLRKSWKY